MKNIMKELIMIMIIIMMMVKVIHKNNKMIRVLNIQAKNQLKIMISIIEKFLLN